MMEMRLREEIREIDAILEYINLIGNDAKRMNQNVADAVTSLRKNGLRTETADILQQSCVTTLNNKIDAMINRMMKNDKRYWEEVRYYLKRASES